MNHPYSKYPFNSKNFSSVEQSSSYLATNNLLSDCNDENLSLLNSNGAAPPKPLNIYINPNSVASSGSVYINKKMFNVNKNAPVRTPFNEPQVNPTISEKIHYNPKFLIGNTGNPVVVSNPKNIHVNPNFAKNFKMDRITDNMNSNKAFLAFSSLEHDDSTYFQSASEHYNSDKCISQNSNISLNHCYSFSSADRTLNSNTMKNQSVRCGFQNKLSLSDKYHKINIQSSPSVAFKISKYKIQRNGSNTMPSLSKICFPTNLSIPIRKSRLSSSFKKIGKRKLVRKSLVQRYISSRRHSLPLMLQHSRYTIASRRKKNKLISQTNYKNSKYRLVRNDEIKLNIPPLRLNHKTIDIPIKSKLKWKRSSFNNSRSKDFIKIGKRKIVRKSIIQSILEARRARLPALKYLSCRRNTTLKEKSKSPVKGLSSRYKVIRNASQQSSHLNIRSQNAIHKSMFKINRKKESGNLNQFVKSKSIFFRMPPSLRLKIRLDEKIKRMGLLKKVNNRKKCFYYNRFGYCKGLENGSCKKVHDPKSVAVCRKFLKGMCHDDHCKLSHKVIPEKMPTCHQFLAGVCVRPSCPFLHVKLSDRHPICLDFLQGFCHLGDSCSKRHQFVCPDLDEKGFCKTDKCPYPHPSATSNKKDMNEVLKKSMTKKNDKSSSITLCDEIKRPTDELHDRYFSETNDAKSLKEISDDNGKVLRGKPETKDGISSVYNNESLLSFIPFS